LKSTARGAPVPEDESSHPARAFAASLFSKSSKCGIDPSYRGPPHDGIIMIMAIVMAAAARARILLTPTKVFKHLTDYFKEN
jgi:hypothetical protein